MFSLVTNTGTDLYQDDIHHLVAERGATEINQLTHLRGCFHGDDRLLTPLASTAAAAAVSRDAIT